MYDLPKDIVNNLSKKYPNINIEKLFRDILEEILEKTFTDGACTIRTFGKFIAYQTYSTRLNKNLCNFKFRPGVTFKKRIQEDEYLLNNLPFKSKASFTEKHEQSCQRFQDQKQINYENRKLTEKYEKKRTREKLAKIEILNILEEDANAEK